MYLVIFQKDCRALQVNNGDQIIAPLFPVGICATFGSNVFKVQGICSEAHA
jgi:hypothetical protein